jgi:hypothetical protein
MEQQGTTLGLTPFLHPFADCLNPLQQDFDICPSDFPGLQSRVLAKIGIRATGWWLLPDKPDWFSSGDLDVPVGVVHEAQKYRFLQMASLASPGRRRLKD